MSIQIVKVFNWTRFKK